MHCVDSLSKSEVPVLSLEELARRLAMLEAIKVRAVQLEDASSPFLRVILLTILTIGGIALTLVSAYHTPEISIPLKFVSLLVFGAAVVLSIRSKDTVHLQEKLLETQLDCYPSLDLRTFTQLQTVDRHHGKLHPTAVLRWVSIEAKLLNTAIAVSRDAQRQVRSPA